MERNLKHLYEFGPFLLDSKERLLLRDGKAVPLTPKAFDVLLVLVEQAGHLLEKEELLNKVWPDSFVEENNLADNVSRLRKALGEEENGQKFIETVPKRGYRFVAEVRNRRFQHVDDVKVTLEELKGDSDSGTLSVVAEDSSKEPRRMHQNPYLNRVMIRDAAEFIGRKTEIEKVYSRIGAATPQSVSIVGERRIGKSSLLYHLSRPEIYSQNLTDSSRYIFVLVDLHGLGDLTVLDFFDLLLDEISVASGISRPHGIPSGYLAMKRFLLELDRSGRKLVLLWDEFESITRNRRFGEEFFSFFRSVANRYDVAYVTTAVRELQEICHTESVAVSPFFNIFTNLYLRVFSPEEARELICRPSGRAQIPLDEHEPTLLDAAGYFPFLLQLACCSLFDQLAQGVQKERAVERARLQFAEEARPHVLYACHHMEPELRELLRLIANGEIPPAKLSDLQEQLLRDGYLITTKQGLKLFSSFFPRWLDDFDKTPTPTWTGRMPPRLDAETRTLFAQGHRYTIIRELGSGGMSSVMLAHDNLLGQQVALKILNPILYSQPGMLLRFKRETALARELRHPNICPVFDLVEDEGRYKIAMKYIDGITLKDRIRESRGIETLEFLDIARQILYGLTTAHQSLIHRDLKPQNIMIDRRGHVYILDFGLAYLPADKESGFSVRAEGTPAYMSPEQIEGRPVDHRSDLYSLGVIFFEMLTRELPFSANTVPELFSKHQHALPPSPSALRSSIASHIDKLILSLLAKAPAERPLSAQAVLNALNEGMTRPDRPIRSSKRRAQ